MFVELDKIPIGPYPNVKGTNCAFDSISEQDQKFKLSGLIREKGWLVLAEIQLAHYRSVFLRVNLTLEQVSHFLFRRAVVWFSKMKN